MRIQTLLQSIWKCRRGGSMVEFAVVAPLMFAVTIGAVDFGRMFVEAAVVAGAANSGAVWGYRKAADAGNGPAVEAAIMADAATLIGVTASSEVKCTCADNPTVFVDCGTAVCTGISGSLDRTPRAYVASSASKTFETLADWPLIPSSVNLGMTSYMRIQ